MRLYRLLLRIYPSSFRHEYGEEMARLFAERTQGAALPQQLGVCREAIADALATAPRIHADILRQDLRYTVRTLSRSRGFAFTAILVMALGIGATTAVFSVADRVLLRPLPFDDPDRLVRLWENVPGYPQLEPSPANYLEWKNLTHSFDGLAAHFQLSLNLVLREPERIQGAGVTWNLFPLLGVQPALGRGFLEAEDRPGPPNVAILSDRLWRRVFNADPEVIGRSLRLDDDTVTVIGVMPPDFFFPDTTADVWLTARFAPSVFDDDDNNFLGVIGRLSERSSLDSARVEMNAVMAAMERARRSPTEGRATVRLLGDQVPWQSAMLLRVLASAGLCLLVIACTNMASLLLTRFVARQREVALRTALGAGRERLTRQLLTESGVLAVLGGALGVALAVAATPVLARLAPINLPVPPASALDLRVLGFATLLTIATGVAFGVLPALSLWRRNDALVLRDGERTTPGRDRLRATLIVLQVAASVLLLVSAGLLLRALVRVQSVSPGFSTAGVLTMRTTPSGERYTTTSARARFYERVVREVEALPGVQSAAYTSFTPMAMRGGIWAVEIPGVTTADSDEQVHTASLRFVTPRFFETLQVPIVEGRDVAASDTFEAPFVAVVSESFARRYWPGQEAVGRRFTFAFRERLIVGVVGDIRVRGLERISEPQVYLPHKQVPDGGLVFYTPKDLLIRTAGDPSLLAPSVRKVIRAADPELAISDVMPLEEVVALQMASRQTQLRVLGVFAAASLLLTGVGLHGLLAFNVAQRRKEIGVRVALGASRARVVRLVAARGITLALAGAVGGLVLANLMAVRFSDLLFGVSPLDPATYATAVGLILVVAASGSLLPALRALRVDPCTALRGD